MVEVKGEVKKKFKFKVKLKSMLRCIYFFYHISHFLSCIIHIYMKLNLKKGEVKNTFWS